MSACGIFLKKLLLPLRSMPCMSWRHAVGAGRVGLKTEHVSSRLQSIYDVGKSIAESIRKSLTSTIGANIGVLPVLLFTFHRVSLIAPLANVAIGFAVPYAMAFGALSAFSSFLFLPLSRVFGWSAWVFLEYILKVVALFDKS